MSDFIPQFRSKKPKKFVESSWLDFEEPQVILFQGMRGSGKGVAVEKTAEKLYREGINVWHLWSARSFENLFWIINQNCYEKYQKMKSITKGFFMKDHSGGLFQKTLSQGLITSREEFDYYIGIMEEAGLLKIIRNEDESKKHFQLIEQGLLLAEGQLLHCNCSRSFPVLWAVPDYIEIDQDSVDRFNKKFWADLEEYGNYFKEITKEERDMLEQGKLRKPDGIAPKPLIKIQHFTTPTSKPRKEKFRDEFTKIVLEARDEQRILVLTPAIFEGELDKFETVTEIFRMIPYLMNKSGHFMPLTESEVGKPRKYWTKKQKSWHKVAIVANELRSIAPSSKLHGEKSASLSKKAIADYIPEARHYKTWFLGDYQNPQDLYDGVRYQANIVVIKRGSRNILGMDWNWLFDRVIRDRMGFIKYRFKRDIEKPEQVGYFERKYHFIKQFNDERRPYVDFLPDNVGYVTWVDNEFKRVAFEMPSFHHKHSTEDFKQITGINWKVNLEKKPQDTKILSKSEAKLATNQKKKIKEEIFKKIDYMRQTEQKSWSTIKEELVLQEKEGIIPEMNYDSKTSVYFSNEYNKWKKRNYA